MREMLEPSFPEDDLTVVRSFNVFDHNSQLLWIGFTKACDWLSGLIGKSLVWFWFYDIQLKTHLS